MLTSIFQFGKVFAYTILANKKTSTMTQEQIKTLAEKALKSIKATISAEKKSIKDYREKHPWDKRHRNPSAELYISLKHNYYGAKDEKYRLTMSDPHYNGKDKHIVEVDTRYDLESIIRALFGLLYKQIEVKGWATLKIVRDKAEFGSGWNRDYVEYPSKVILCDPPCKEFTALQNYLNKYGVVKYRYTTYPFKLANYELFTAAMGGKRGRLWNEYGEREYLDHDAERCAQILANLRKFRGTKDTMYCEKGEENYIDPVDREYSERHELDCEGEKRSYLSITIQSPSGKNKYETKIF